MVPNATAYIPLIESIPLWHGDVDVIERALSEQAPLDEFQCTAIQ